MAGRDTTLLEGVRAACRRERLLPPDAKVVVAFSGGPDSLALLDVLVTLIRDRERIAALHLDHGIRGGSADEAARARELGAALGVEVAVRRLRGLGDSPANLEERAREARREALRAHARLLGADVIALGHTADDQAETVLMRLLRGAGSRGLAAMAYRQTPWIRPLLGCSRSDVEAHLASRGLEPVLDPSNRSSVYLRNRVRRTILPLLREENPRVVETLSRLAVTAREESEALDVWAAELSDALCEDGGLEVAPLAELPPGIVHRLLASLYRGARGDLRRLDRRHLEALAALCQRPHGVSRLDLPGCTAIREYGRLRIEPRGLRSPSEPLQPFEIKGPGRWGAGGDRQLEVTLEEARDDEQLALPLCQIHLPVSVRGPRPGDRLCIERIRGQRHRRVSRMLIDAKIPLGERNSTPLVLSQEGEVLLVVGVRRAAGLDCPRGAPVLRFQLRA